MMPNRTGQRQRVFRSRHPQRMAQRMATSGFTLLEVMLALAILLGGLVMLVTTTHDNIRATNRAKYLTVATNLARTRMLDIEEELLHNGFQETDETMEGDFSEEGYRKLDWSAVIEKVELPDPGKLQAAFSDEPNSGSGSSNGEDGSGAGLASILGDNQSSASGAALILSQFTVVKEILENAIRKVTLTIRWKMGRTEDSLTVVCYFTDPKAITQATGGTGH
ncbi:MAG: prepilin-type N-terminal cleavage/methylation domain-containing protein [Pseudomonadota bacterium]